MTVYFILFLNNCRLTLKAQTMSVRMELQETFKLRNLWKMKRTENKRKKKRKSKTIPWRYGKDNKAVLSVGFLIVNCNYIIYSGIPSCGHSIEMATLLLWPHYSGPNKSSVYYGHPVSKARFLLPVGDEINGFHCTWSDLHNLAKVGSFSSDSMPELLFTVKNHVMLFLFLLLLF